MPQSAQEHQLVQTLVSYLPPALAREIAQEQRPLEQPRTRVFQAALLLTDISGFTRLTEQLAASGPDGAEELTAILNRYFSRMIGLLEAEGGEVVQFSGDALIATFPAPSATALPLSVQVAWQAAQAMQHAVEEFATLTTSVGTVALGMKIIIGVGEVTALSVGGMFQRWQYVIAGDPLRQVAEGEKQAQRGGIVLSPEAAALFPNQPSAARPLVLPSWGTVSAATLTALRSHIPGSITHRMIAGQDDWLSELRVMSVLFMGIGGLSIGGGAALSHAQACMFTFQQTVYRYEGSINKLLVDDKGVIAIALFGAPPLAHLDDPLRAVRCALDLQQILAEQGLRIAIGITTGQLFAGSVGSPTRREYTVIGDVVNLAARLMQLAGRGNTLADHPTYTATRDDLEWEVLAPQVVKGRTTPARIYRPIALHSGRRTSERPALLIGRLAERQQLASCLETLSAGSNLQLHIEGDPGMGKTRLLRELVRLARARGLPLLLGSGEAIERQTFYQGWREMFEAFFGLEGVAMVEARQARVLERLAALRAQDADLGLRDPLARAPLLNDLLNLGLPESDLTAGLDPKLRQASLAALLVDLLRHQTATQPLVLVFEDVHWLDSLAWECILQAVRGLSSRAVLIVLAMRSFDAPVAAHPLNQLKVLPSYRHIVLAPLSSTETLELATACLQQAQLDPLVADVFYRHTSGSPFVVEELALSLIETQAVTISEGVCTLATAPAALRLPDTIQGLVLSRIDRLAADQQLVIKVAAVIGRMFGDRVLCEVYPGQLPEESLAEHLQNLQQHALIEPIATPSVLFSYSFRQIIFQEVTYGTLLRTQRSQIHTAVAQWYERSLPLNTDLAATLAYHWRQAGHQANELHYTVVHARGLVASYANREALIVLGRAFELTADPAIRRELLWLRSQVYRRLGDQQARRADLSLLDELAAAQRDQDLQAQLANAWAAFHRDTSDYPAAIVAVERAISLAHQVGNLQYVARSLTIHGQIMEYTGNFEAARGLFAQALERCRAVGDQRGEADNLNNLGNVLRYIGAYHEAAGYYRQALALREALSELAGEVVSLNNLAQLAIMQGTLDEAGAYQQRALALVQVMGDRSGEALIVGTMGDTALMRGHYAVALHSLEQCVQICEAIGERRREASALNQLGMVWRDLGNQQQARHCFEQALHIQRTIGDQSQATYTCLNLGYTLLPDVAAAEALYTEALALAQLTGSRDAEAYALSYRAALSASQGDWPAAEVGYQAALVSWATLDMPASLAEDQAALARVYLAWGREAEAVPLAEACASYLEQEGSAGMEFPLRVYLGAADVLRSLGQPERADRLVYAAHDLLMQRAAAVDDDQLRRAFLLASPESRRLAAEG